jgi:hypothetical protein
MRRARLLTLLIAGPLVAQSPDPDFFEKEIRPIFAKNCYACHGPKLQTAGLNLSIAADSVIVPHDASKSRLYEAIGYTGDPKMPPSGKLPDGDIAKIRTWIDMGAPWPKAAGAADRAPSGGRQITAADRQFWSFQPVKDPALPAVQNEKWVESPIDRYVLAKLEEKRIVPAPPASKLELLRRATFDLTGLPPTTAEITQFLSDTSPDAFAKVVDRLLASPQYGERWGRHWLDVARFADSTGMDEDHLYPNAWRYRDYVVEAFNKDMAYDRFIEEQLAGDLLPAATPEERRRGIIATGFLALGPKPLAQQDRVQMIYDVVDEQIDTTSRAFMGLTVACARCHDHKFDPILTRDYYSLAGIFASTLDFRNLGRPGSVSYVYEAPLDPNAFARYQTQRWRMYGKQLEMEEALAEDQTREYALLRPKIAEMLVAAWKAHTLKAQATTGDSARWQKWFESCEPKVRAGDAKYAWLKNWFDATNETIEQIASDYQKQYVTAAEKWDSQMQKWRTQFAVELAEDRDVPAHPKPDEDAAPFFAAATFNEGPLALPDSERVAQLRREWQNLQKSMPPEPEMAAAVTEGVTVDQRVFLHGDHHNQGSAVGRTFPVALAGESQHSPATGSGRPELARWIASRDHPLTARVMVNRIWQWHFGEALMRTPNNWGKTGDTPANPELLDFLATRFVESNWSIKSLHRLIMLSSTYQMSTKATPEARELDPLNRLNSRFNRVRMSVEELRDALLAISGRLDLTTGGPPPPAREKRKPLDLDDFSRRTLYIGVRRGSVPAILSSFDFGDATTSSEGRPRTNVAPQALFIMNSRFVVERARDFARRLLDDSAKSDRERVVQAYLMSLTRQPDSSEIDSALTYISEMEKRRKGPDGRIEAWQSFCHVLVATNEFLYFD